jgi:hypothetical protein
VAKAAVSSRIGNYIRQHHLALVAIFIALGGTATAVNGPLQGKNQVGSKDIINEDIESVDLKNGEVTSDDVADDTLPTGGLASADLRTESVGLDEIAANAVGQDEIAVDGVSASEIEVNSVGGSEIAPDAVGTNEVGPNALTGDDISEATLGSVPNADNAGSVDGIDLCEGRFSSATTATTTVPVCVSGNLTLELVCANGGSVAIATLQLRSTAPAFNAFYVVEGPSPAFDSSFTSSDGAIQLLSVTGSGGGSVANSLVHFHASSNNGNLSGSGSVYAISISSSLASCKTSLAVFG